MISSRLTNPSFCLLQFRRTKKFKRNWAFSGRKSVASSQLALSQLDSRLSAEFGGALWSRVRLALLSLPKYAALINNDSYLSKAGVETELSNMGAIELLTNGPILSVDGQRLNESEECDDDWSTSSTSTLSCPGSADADHTECEMTSMSITGATGRVVYERPNTDRLIQHRMTRMEDFLPQYSFTATTDHEACEYQRPIALRAMTFDRGVNCRFLPPVMDQKRLLAYYLFDGASLLPVLALDLRSGDHMLDMCASPGGKTLATLQSMLPATICCNDVSGERINRLSQVLHQYRRTHDECGRTAVAITRSNASELGFLDSVFEATGHRPNKVLVDAPCTNDRHALFNDSTSNLFSRFRFAELSELADLQTSLLVNALRLCAPGGTIVYSTCSMMPDQNDMIVDKALNVVADASVDDHKVNTYAPMSDIPSLVTSTRNRYQIVSNKDTIEIDFGYFYHFSKKCRYGSLVLPTILSNFGPMYFCRIKKLY